MTFDIKTLPQSTQDYLTLERVTQFAVDALLEVGLDKLPYLADWNDLTQYYKARAAAELTKVEWAQSMQILWSYIWGAHIDADWTMESIKELGKKQSITIKDCWDDATIELLHYKDGNYLFTAINLSPTSLTLAFGLENDKNFLIEGGLDNFKWGDNKKADWAEWNYHEIQGNILKNNTIIENARTNAIAAIQHCNKQLKW